MTNENCEFALAPTFSVNAPYMVDYFGLWMIHGETFSGLVERCNGMNLHAHLPSDAIRQKVASRDSREYALTSDGIAVFRISGPMMKSVSSMADGTSTVRLRQQIKQAQRDPSVLGAMLVMDTPGGTVKGNEDLANEVALFAAKKPIMAFVEDMTASAGVSIASQATKRYANNATALYGSMGTYAVIQDVSGMAEKLGVKVHVVRAGEFKGMGEAGTPVTEKQLAELQRTVDAMNANYVAIIAKGLKAPVERIRELADGRIHTAQEAVQMGLLNGIQTFDQTYRELLAMVAKPQPTIKGSPAMSERIPATLAELKATFKNSTADWREQQIEAGATLIEAAAAYADFCDAKATAAQESAKKAAEESRAAVKAAGPSLGHQPLVANRTEQSYEGPSGDPVQDFNAAVAAKLPNGCGNLEQRQAAIMAVARQQPDLHKAMIAATNHGSRARRLIAEKYETTGSN